MIKIEVVTKSNIFKKLEAKGHAFFDKKGKDIVCAAISALLQNIYVGLAQIEEIDLNFKTKNGAFYIEVLNLEALKEKDLEKINFLVDATLLSIKTISSSYRIKIEIDKKEVLE